MTAWDRIFLALAVLDVIAVVALAYGAVLLLETGKRGQRQVQPALNEARALADMGKAMANHASANGHMVAKRVTLVAGRVRHRIEHTRRIVEELKPQGRQAATTLQSTGKEVADTARTLGDLSRRVARIKSAADAATRAARNA